MHPIWLQLSDKKVQGRYDSWLRNHVYGILKCLCAINWAYGIFILLINHSAAFEEQKLFAIQLGTLSVSFTVICLLTKLNRKLADYALLLILAIRCAETFLLMHMIDE